MKKKWTNWKRNERIEKEMNELKKKWKRILEKKKKKKLESRILKWRDIKSPYIKGLLKVQIEISPNGKGLLKVEWAQFPILKWTPTPYPNWDFLSEL